ncbi:Kinase-like protein [Mycena sanguinolenta]|uniref:Kinase-like protein n=1 Tax=Mycena sanguinolenta TaxID=230812 RepID=A0A8H6U3M9_9AGAR|nr:Kinase-like protein [Mycena sanguinolenta]
MDSQSESEAEFIVVSTSDYTEALPHSTAVAPQASGLTRNAKSFVKSFGFLPSFLGGARVTEFQNPETSRTYTRKYSETIGMQAVDRLVTNYNYYISGGVGGRGGDARDQGTGGGGGAGQGPTLNFYNSPLEQQSRDLDLIEEIRLDRPSSVVRRGNPGAGVRRMYSANLVRESERRVTVAMYQGDGAEEEWRQDHGAYESIRHPNILQLYGLVNTKKLCGMVFHDGEDDHADLTFIWLRLWIELIPYAEFLRRFEHSRILTTYILGYCVTEYEEARAYHNSIFPFGDLENVYRWLPFWIRPATGQLCVDLNLGREQDNILSDTAQQNRILRLENISLDESNAEALARGFLISPQQSIPHWRTLSQFDPKQGTLLMTTKPLDFGPKVELAWVSFPGLEKEVLPNSWIRYDTRQAHNPDLRIWVRSGDSADSWLSRANYIFSQLQTTSDFEDYVLLMGVDFRLRCLPNPHNSRVPEGYLFVCPAENLRMGEHSFKWPDCAAYWSLDPSGDVRLASEEAKILGFPILHIETSVNGYSWDESVYEGIRRFHAGKGFDPDSQEVAKHLDYPLFELFTEEVSPVPCVEKKVFWCDLEDPAHCQALGHYP